MMRGEWDWTGAQREFDRAITLDPNLGYGRWAKATLLMAFGEKEIAVAEMETARRLDPGSQNTMDDLGWAYDCARNFPESR